MKKRIQLKNLKMKSLGNRKRKIRVFLPKDYDQSKKDYPVLYMHDGQNLVDPSSFSGFAWDILKTMDDSIAYPSGMIIVGIDAHPTKRIQEYSPFLNEEAKDYIIHKVGVPEKEVVPEAKEYGEFIVKQLKPYIDRHYRTCTDEKNTFIAGSSCGGIVSIYIGLKYPDIFSVIGAFSPAYWLLKEELFTWIRAQTIPETTLIYHDMGDLETEMNADVLVDQREFDHLIKQKINPKNVVMVVDSGAIHNEYYWALRFRKFYQLALDHAK